MQIAGINDNGDKITGNKYLFEKVYDDGDTYADIVRPNNIFNYLDWAEDMIDTPEIHAYLLRSGKTPMPVEIFGAWHNLDDPLRMEIRTKRGKVLDVGYGTDH